MGSIYLTASIWLALAVLSSILASHLRLSMALVEICLGVAAGAIARSFFPTAVTGVDQDWLKLLAGAGAIMLTFLSGAELEYQLIRLKWREVLYVGLMGFAAPFLGCTTAATYC